MGEPKTMLPPPQRLSWDIPAQVYRLEIGRLGLTLRMKGQEHLRVLCGPQGKQRPRGCLARERLRSVMGSYYPITSACLPPLHQAQHGLMLNLPKLSFVCPEAIGLTPPFTVT